MRRAGRVIGVVIMVCALLVSAHVAFGAYGPRPGERAQQSLVDALEHEIADGAAEQAQQIFPEGSFFLHGLTGIAQARLGGADNLAAARAHLTRLGSGAELVRFGSGMVPEHGIFAAGWSLQLAVDIAASSGEESDLGPVTALAEEIATAVRESPTPYLASYPGQFWPCDSVVALSALTAAAGLPSVADDDAQRWRATVQQWRAASDQLNPPGTLLPHRTDADGRGIEGPRGSSQAIIQTFWPTLAPDDDHTWLAFTSAFVTREAGLVGVREHPIGQDGAGDIDSGPLVLGVSLSASTVTLGAARANGATELAAELDRSAEVFGVPARIGPRRYAAGLVPVGEAFLAFARSRPTGTATTTMNIPQPWWPLWWGPGLVVAGLAGWFVLSHGDRRARSRTAPHRS